MENQDAEPANQRPICLQTYTLARRSYSQISSLIGLTRFCDVVFFLVTSFCIALLLIGCGRYSLLVSTKLFDCRFFFSVLTYSFVLFVLCVRMKVWLHFIAWKCLKITWFVFVSYTFIYRFKCRDKINASFCIFISSSLSFWVTFKAFYSSLL